MPPPSIEDLNLPTQAPHFTKDRGPPGEPAEFAIYHIADLTREACQELGDLINSDPSGCSASKLAPSPDFTNRSVRDVYDSFLTLREEDDTIQPFFFIVADRSEFEEGGVLGVCLDCSQEGEGDVGVVRCDAEWADSYGAQLVEGMVSWEELKEYEAARGDEYERVRSMGVEERHAHEAGKYGWEAGTSTVRVRDIYGWYSLVQNAVPINQMLDPLWLEKSPDQCRFQMLGNWYSSTDPWEDICREHPRQSAFRPRVNRTIVLVAEKEDADEEDGVAIVRLASQRAPLVLARVRASMAIAEADSWAH